MKKQYELNDISSLVSDLRNSRHQSRYAFAKETGVNDMAIKRIEDNDHSPSVKHIVKLLRQAGYQPYITLRRLDEK